MIRTILPSGLLVLLSVAGAEAATTPAAGPDYALLCEDAARRAAAESGVPLSVLRAIALTETGRKRDGGFKPWPWTVNMEGKGVWFDRFSDARGYVETEFARGARSFDVGCFQINYKWHGTAFASIDEMFDPMVSARYAARLLGELYAETGTWRGAAGAYHSRTPEFANRYADRFEAIRARLTGEAGDDVPEIPDIVAVANGAPAPDMVRVNWYPLLQAGTGSGTGSALGSLVPLSAGTGSSLFAPPADATSID